ncbi:uncharacterized protein STEHIDRAFT_110792 [Stereum hirsutum FP-91666 SS1]|uniref:uncharacterized protein n=1 Tax=Stereum hirsutum (strain FP-91666) TaxID=721885 RepID=UPI0004409FB5|nr:uncharacterized protein STEHIDRAFT_110792 [Stereum hirsutum FP-91666 SS1]EIM87620.1 hypothetical protein STEHIDRAFT_110792 [Stereum hirsutum FP-91666 SS1]
MSHSARTNPATEQVVSEPPRTTSMMVQPGGKNTGDQSQAERLRGGAEFAGLSPFHAAAANAIALPSGPDTISRHALRATQPFYTGMHRYAPSTHLLDLRKLRRPDRIKVKCKGKDVMSNDRPTVSLKMMRRRVTIV